MGARTLTDEEIFTVAAVARREGWTDLAAPPETHAPRSLSEEGAVARFADASRDRAKRVRSGPWRVRLGMVAIALVVIGVCWWISPERTAIALIVAGLLSLIALRVKGRRRGRRRAGPLG